MCQINSYASIYHVSTLVTNKNLGCGINRSMLWVIARSGGGGGGGRLGIIYYYY